MIETAIIAEPPECQNCQNRNPKVTAAKQDEKQQLLIQLMQLLVLRCITVWAPEETVILQ